MIRSNREAGKPNAPEGLRARALGRDPASRRASWPADLSAAPTGRRHGRADQPHGTHQVNLAYGGRPDMARCGRGRHLERLRTQAPIERRLSMAERAVVAKQVVQPLPRPRTRPCGLRRRRAARPPPMPIILSHAASCSAAVIAEPASVDPTASAAMTESDRATRWFPPRMGTQHTPASPAMIHGKG